MALHIVVYEDYTPEVFNGVAAVAYRYRNYFLDEEESRPVTVDALRKEIKENGAARLYAEGATEWTHKVFVR